MAIIPFADELLIPPGSNDPRIKARIGILHVDAGNAESLYTYFRDRSGGIESHGFIKRTGVLEQYRDTAWQADANYLANDFAISFETQGFGEGEWTAEQLDTIKRVMLWAKKAHDIPLRKVTSWNDAQGGWGYHTLFPSQWSNVPGKTCPGPDRIKQFNDILWPWMLAGGHMEAAKPTPNITAALETKDRTQRRAALQRVVKYGTDAAQQAALHWLAAMDAADRAHEKAKNARQDIKQEEIR